MKGDEVLSLCDVFPRHKLAQSFVLRDSFTEG